jgi:hypothetical protein
VALNSLHINLPQEATNVKARDAVGLINSAINVVEGEEGYTDLRVSPRLALSQGDRWTFTAEYSMPREGYIEGEGGNLRLTYTSQGFPHYIRRFLVHAELPEGGAYATSNPDPVSVKKTSTMTQLVILDLGGIEPLESSEFYLEYKRSIMWNALRPLQWTLIAGGFIVILVFLSKRRKVEEERPIEVERVDIGEFLGLYRERLNLLAELEDLEMSAERRDIGRDKYNQRSAEIIRRQRELTSTLKQLERRIVRVYPVIGDRIREIRALEVELNKAETDLRSLEVRRRTRRVSRRDYQRRKRQCINERSKTRRSLEQLISVLQAER